MTGGARLAGGQSHDVFAARLFIRGIFMNAFDRDQAAGGSSRDDQACLSFFEKQTWQSIWFKLYHLVRAKQPQPPLLACGYCTAAAPNDVTTERMLTLIMIERVMVCAHDVLNSTKKKNPSSG